MLHRTTTSTALLALTLSTFPTVLSTGCPLPGDEGGEGEGEGEGEDPCVIGDVLGDRTLSPDECAIYAAAGSVEVQAGATLTLAPGTVLTFTDGNWLRINDGSLIAEGSAEDPIVLRSDDDDAEAGAWIGVYVTSATEDFVLRFVQIEAGGEDAFGGDGCLTIEGGAGDLTVEDSTFTRCDRAAIVSDEPFNTFARNSVVDSDLGFDVMPDVIGSVDALTLSGTPFNRFRNGDVTRTATWVAQSVPWIAEGDLEIGGDDTPVLTLAAGNELRFGESHWLRVAGSAPGGLVADGVDGDEVVFSSVDTGAGAGAWLGLYFAGETLSGSRLTHAIVKQGGENAFGARGCVTISEVNAGALSVTDSTFDTCAQAGFVVESDVSQLAAFSGNTFANSTVGLSFAANTLGSVEDAQTYTAVSRNEVRNGDVTISATWVTQAIPFHVDDSIEVNGDDNPVLTLQPNTLRFTASNWLRVGAGAPGGVTATDVVFGSVDTGAGAGAWLGLYFDAETTTSVLDGVTVQQAGEDAFGSRGGVTLDRTEGAVTIRNSTFADNEQTDIFIDCDSSPTLSGNTGTATVDPSCA